MSGFNEAPNICRICGAESIEFGTIMGKFKEQAFHLNRCPVCFFSFVSNPWTDYGKIYSSDYYSGRGADPLVDYMFELEYPGKTIRQYEWRGVLKVVRSLVKVDSETRWLDYGCGNGGLVRYCSEKAKCRIVGFEEGWIKGNASTYGIPYLDWKDLQKQEGVFDIITAIEVLEHVENPLESLKRIRTLLKPGGLFFYTTGNAKPFRDHLLKWRYVIPEIHISYFEPETLDYALQKSGFRTEFKRFMPGFTDIIRFKILKNFRQRSHSFSERFLPWEMLARIADKKFKITAHPIAWAEEAAARDESMKTWFLPGKTLS